MRKSRLRVLVLVVRAREMGYYVRGERPVFDWLARAGLVERVPPERWEYTATDEGRAELERVGLCAQCGSSGSYAVRDGMGWRWNACACCAAGQERAASEQGAR